MSDAQRQIGPLETATRDRLHDCAIWYNITPNFKLAEATSCRSAILIRDRLGSGENGGVPLWVELKSEIGVLRRKTDGRSIVYAAHTRANCDVDHERLWQAIGLDVSEYTREEGTKKDGEFFGLVNPLNIDIIMRDYYGGSGYDVVQAFDSLLLVDEGFPTTVTTNAGHRQFGLEIAPSDLIACVKKHFGNVFVSDFSKPEDIWLGRKVKHEGKAREDWQRFPPPDGPMIGMLTGNSPESGLVLWNDFLAQYRSLYNNTADVFMPDTLVHSLPAMGLTMELVLREDAVWKEVEKGVVGLLKAGCKLITVACNTTIYFQPQIDALCREYGAQFVSIADACVEAIKRRFGKKTHGLNVGLVGIGPVVDLAGGYSGYERRFRDAGIVAKGCDGTSLAFTVKNIGNDEKRINAATAKFRKLVNDQLANESVIVLSLTEISILYRNHIQTAPKKQTGAAEKIFIDPLSELAKYLTYKYVSAGLRQCKICSMADDFPVDSRVAEMVFGPAVEVA